jgi:hypothetical protein
MLSHDHSGVFSWLAGLSLIVITGVGLSMLADRRFQFSSNNKEIESVIANESEQLADLQARLQTEQASFDKLDHPRQLGAREADEHLARLPLNRAKLTKLRTTAATLQTEASSCEDSIAAYRKSYRNQVWQGAIGEKHAEIPLRSGRRYLAATILRVTTVGLEISHQDGLARIDFIDLDQAWQERFQWQHGERQSTTAGETDATK